MKQLPTFRGYTVDRRLGQFRKVKRGEALEFIDFASPRGRELLAELRSRFPHQR